MNLSAFLTDGTEDEQFEAFTNRLIVVRPIRETPPAVLFEIWHDQPFAPCVEIIEEAHDAQNRNRR